MNKIIITVQGGLIQSVCSTEPVKIVCIDYDTAEECDEFVNEWDSELYQFPEDVFTGKLSREEKIAKRECQRLGMFSPGYKVKLSEQGLKEAQYHKDGYLSVDGKRAEVYTLPQARRKATVLFPGSKIEKV